MIKRKFSISEQAGTPVDIIDQSSGGTALFTQSTHHTTSAQALAASTVATVGMADASDIKGSNGPVTITLTFSAVGGAGVTYFVLTGADGNNFDTTKSTATVTTNKTVVIENIEAPYVGVLAWRAGSNVDDVGKATCIVSGVREVYRTAINQQMRQRYTTNRQQVVGTETEAVENVTVDHLSADYS